MGVRVGRDVAVAVGIGSGVALAVAVGSGSGVAVGGGADNAAQARLTAEKGRSKILWASVWCSCCTPSF